MKKQTLNSHDNQEVDFWNQKEWTLKMILQRIVCYGLTVIFIIIGVALIIEGMWEGIVPVLISVKIGLTYVKADIQILLEKRRRRKRKKRELLGEVS